MERRRWSRVVDKIESPAQMPFTRRQEFDRRLYLRCVGRLAEQSHGLGLFDPACRGDDLISIALRCESDLAGSRGVVPTSAENLTVLFHIGDRDELEVVRINDAAGFLGKFAGSRISRVFSFVDVAAGKGPARLSREVIRFAHQQDEVVSHNDNAGEPLHEQSQPDGPSDEPRRSSCPLSDRSAVPR